jgi:hypothetical protein
MNQIIVDHCLNILACVCGLAGVIIAIKAKNTWNRNSKFRITSTGLLALCLVIVAITATVINSYFDVRENLRKQNSNPAGSEKTIQYTGEDPLLVRDSVKQFIKEGKLNSIAAEILNEEKPSDEIIKTALSLDSDKMQKRAIYLFVGFDETY